MGQAGLLDLFQPRLHQSQTCFVVQAGGVLLQVGTFGDNVDTRKQSDGLVHHQIHDVALALDADQLHGQETAEGLDGGNHLGAGQASGGDHPVQIDAIQQRDK